MIRRIKKLISIKLSLVIILFLAIKEEMVFNTLVAKEDLVSCTGPYSADLSKDHRVAYKQVLERLFVMAFFNANMCGCVNLKGANLENVILTEADMSEVKGLSVNQLENAYELYALKLPAMDLSNLSKEKTKELEVKDAPKKCQNLKKISSLSVEKLNQRKDLSHLKLPAIDVSKLETREKSIQCSDFSKTSGLNIKQINQAISLRGLRLPLMDLKGLAHLNKL